MRQDRARYQPQPADKHNQHHQRVEEGGWLEIDVHVGNHAGKYEERSGYRQYPPYRAAPAEEKNADSEQQRYESNAETVAAVKTPVRTDHRHLVRQQISTDANHDEADQEFSQSALCSTH